VQGIRHHGHAARDNPGGELKNGKAEIDRSALFDSI